MKYVTPSHLIVKDLRIYSKYKILFMMFLKLDELVIYCGCKTFL